MNKRLQQFLAAENISQSKFAETLGVARAGVSHVLSGRNKPGFEFLDSLARNYPDLSLEWLISGRGRMYKDGRQGESPQIFEPQEPSLFAESTQHPDIQATAPYGRKIEKVVLFYSDGTYQEIS
ncbi:MAG: helix-turn-helix transcriptional regulator [Bacteroidales bacterium]|nr:helix-turn-helix transcriptional regulator [Bacteroidales bacterium]